jgi:hypothetical protein
LGYSIKVIASSYREWLSPILYTQGGLACRQPSLLYWLIQGPHFEDWLIGDIFL